MRRALLAVGALGAMLAGFFGSVSPASSVDGLVVDYAVSVVSNPATVSPAGEVVEYRITVANQGLAEVAATVTDSTDGGTLVAVPPGCEGAGGTAFTCDVSVAPGASLEIDVLIVTPTDGDDEITNTASVVVHSSLLNPVVDTDQSDNTGHADTAIVAADTTQGSSAFLRQGETLQFRGHVLTVLEVYGDSGGVSATMKDSTVTAGTTCGAPNRCHAEGLNVTYTDGADGERSEGLVEIDLFFAESDPCYGNGNPDCRAALYYRVAVEDVAAPIANCVDGRPTEGEGPCYQGFYKQGQLFHQVIRMFTADPDILQQAKELTPIKG